MRPNVQHAANTALLALSLSLGACFEEEDKPQDSKNSGQAEGGLPDASTQETDEDAATPDEGDADAGVEEQTFPLDAPCERMPWPALGSIEECERVPGTWTLEIFDLGRGVPVSAQIVCGIAQADVPAAQAAFNEHPALDQLAEDLPEAQFESLDDLVRGASCASGRVLSREELDGDSYETEWLLLWRYEPEEEPSKPFPGPCVETTVDASGEPVARRTIQYEDGRQSYVQEIYDDEMYDTSYEYEDGRLVGIYTLDSTGQSYTEVAYEFDPDSFEEVVVETNEWGPVRRSYYDEWGREYLETWAQDGESTPDDRREYVYNLYGDLVQELLYFRDGASPIQVRTFSYDYRGLRVLEVWTDPATGEVTREERYTYDASGNVVKAVADLGPKPDGKSDQTTTYDYSCW